MDLEHNDTGITLLESHRWTDGSSGQPTTHYSSAENGDVLDTVVHQNIRFLLIIVYDIRDSPTNNILHAGSRLIQEPFETS
jgi:hypothetical protein